MLGVKAAILLAHRLAYAQDQAYYPCEQEKKHDEDCRQTSQEPSSQSQDSPAHMSDDLFHSSPRWGSCPLYAAMLH